MNGVCQDKACCDCKSREVGNLYPISEEMAGMPPDQRRCVRCACPIYLQDYLSIAGSTPLTLEPLQININLDIR